MAAEVRVMVYQAALDDEQLAAVRDAYQEVSRRLATVPGLLGNELLRNPHDPTSLVVMSRWVSREAFDAWESGEGHRQDTAPLRPYRDDRTPVPFAVYEVEAAH